MEFNLPDIDVSQTPKERLIQMIQNALPAITIEQFYVHTVNEAIKQNQLKTAPIRSLSELNRLDETALRSIILEFLRCLRLAMKARNDQIVRNSTPLGFF